MKLLSRYNRILMFASAIGLIGIGFLFYRTLSFYLNKQIDNNLVEELMEVKDFTHSRNIAPAPEQYLDLVIEYKRTGYSDTLKRFADTVFYNPKKKLLESARYLRTGITIDGSHYQVLIFTSKVEREEQIKSIFLAIISPVLLLLVALLLINRLMIRKLWQPFRLILENLKTFNLNQEKPFEVIKSPVEEFRELNQAILDISLRIRSDFREVKLFTENASHEMMTPLAVINSKLDMMLQSDRLGKEESETLVDLYKATSRLTKLNQSLLLLVKIDNNLISEQEEVDVSALLVERLSYFQELIQNRNLSVITTLNPVIHKTNRYLLETLVNNLLSNSIRHNYENGNIEISLTAESIIFKNTGRPLALDEHKIFDRFYKDHHSEGTGLGLAILKQICNRQHFSFKYTYTENLHCFEIRFKLQSADNALAD
ncbi:sensor histidine kinase [Pedobacter sp. GR22-6]|uniref:sensor histidine kinase n=1 Tax=Pedobacter sp. GR22-6 TaxID=3127957 RepID=UPI00307E8A14